MEQLRLNVNGTSFEVEADPSTPLLWVLRDMLGLTGTKFGCGVGQCRACTVHLDGAAVASCQLPVSSVQASRVTTIEGLTGASDRAGSRSLHVLQRTWIERAVPQCGYCQSGQLMAASALLAANPSPSDEEIDSAMRGNLCRCGTYKRIRAAIHAAAESGATRETTSNGGQP